MSKIEVYKCDSCSTFTVADESYGVSLAPDMFDTMEGHKTVMNPAKAEVHYCQTCYNEYVTSAATREVNRRHDEPGYNLKVKEFSYMLRYKCVTTYLKNK